MTRQRQFALIAAALFALLVLTETLRSDGPFDPVALAADLLEFPPMPSRCPGRR
jgi:hypothetical protein